MYNRPVFNVLYFDLLTQKLSCGVINLAIIVNKQKCEIHDKYRCKRYSTFTLGLTRADIRNIFLRLLQTHHPSYRK